MTQNSLSGCQKIGGIHDGGWSHSSVDSGGLRLTGVVSMQSLLFYIGVDLETEIPRPEKGGVLMLAACLHILDEGRQLRDQIIHILKHGAFCRAQMAGPVDVLHDLLILALDLVKELADYLKVSLGLAVCTETAPSAAAVIFSKLSPVWDTIPTFSLRVCWDERMLSLRWLA